MRIAYVHSTDFPSLEANVVQVVQMSRALTTLGQDVTLLIPRAEKFASDDIALSAAKEMFGGNLPFKIEFVPRIRLFGRLETLGTVRGTLRAIRRNHFDLIYTRNAWTVPFLPQANIPYVFEAHEERVHLRSELLNKYLRNTIVRNSRKPQCVLVVGISAALCKIWEGFGVPREKLLPAHDAVELDMFNPSLSNADARTKLNLSGTKPIVVYTGAMKPDRGIDLMLRAADKLHGLDFYFIGGKDNELLHWRSEAERLKLGNAHFMGRVPHKEIPAWLAAADILLMMWTWQVPTIRGCSPMKMFEYMAAERLIVGPSFPTVCEVLENGKDGLLFEPDNLDGLIAALAEAAQRFNDPALPRAAREKVARDYTWQARCRKILEAVEERMQTSGRA